MINAQEIAKCYEVMEAAEGLVKKEAETKLTRGGEAATVGARSSNSGHHREKEAGTRVEGTGRP